MISYSINNSVHEIHVVLVVDSNADQKSGEPLLVEIAKSFMKIEVDV